MACSHTEEKAYWVEDDFWGDGHGWWEYETKGTYEDIDLGRYRCTRCYEIFYYTGKWKEHHEGGRKLLDERTGHVKG